MGGSDTPTGRHATTGSCSQVWTRAAETHRRGTSTQLRPHLLPTHYKLGAGSTKGSLGAPSRRRARRVWGSMACKAAVRTMRQRSGRRVNASSIKQRRLIKVENWLSVFFFPSAFVFTPSGRDERKWSQISAPFGKNYSQFAMKVSMISFLTDAILLSERANLEAETFGDCGCNNNTNDSGAETC